MSQTLHTATPSIVVPLLQIHLRSQEPTLTYTCLRRLLTALIHHCRGAEQFLPVSELLTEKISSLARSLESDKDTDCLNRLIEIISVVSSVRQGSRMTGALLIICLYITSDISISQSVVFHHCDAFIPYPVVLIRETFAPCLRLGPHGRRFITLDGRRTRFGSTVLDKCHFWCTVVWNPFGSLLGGMENAGISAYDAALA